MNNAALVKVRLKGIETTFKMLLNRSNEYEMRVELEDFDGNKRFAQYGKFGLGSEKDKYRLEIGDYQGDAGDSLNDPWYGSNMRPFSTYNK